MNEKIKSILDYAFPITAEDRGCSHKMQKKMAQRERLRLMIERYKRGEPMQPDPLLITVDFEEIKKRINN